MMKVEIYGKQNCRYCQDAKSLCDFKRIDYDYHDIVEDEDRHNEMLERLGFQPKTVPQIWVDGRHIGGFTELLCIVDAIP